MRPEDVKQEQREFYALGDYSFLSAWFMPAAEALVEACACRRAIACSTWPPVTGTSPWPPRGVAGIASWTPGGFNAQVVAAAEARLPAGDDDPEGPEPEDWADPTVARERLGPHAASVDVSLRPLVRRAQSADALWEEARRRVPALLGLEQMMSADDFEDFGVEYREIIERHARPAQDGIDVVVEYALIVAR
jgi:hypothetical protein